MKTIAQFAASLEGYDPQSLPAEGVLDFLSRLVSPVAESRALPLFEALGKVLSRDVISPLDVPPHDNSAMDGYAFDGRQLRQDAPLQLKVAGTALAGKAWAGQAGAGECVEDHDRRHHAGRHGHCGSAGNGQPG
jgi:molybdopterin molybdotransferase